MDDKDRKIAAYKEFGNAFSALGCLCGLIVVGIIFGFLLYLGGCF